MSKHNSRTISLRIAAPTLYNKMIETFEEYHIHPYDVQGMVRKNKDSYDVKLTFANMTTQTVSKQFSKKQVEEPDSEVVHFFKESAENCKNHLITDYYKMIKV